MTYVAHGRVVLGLQHLGVALEMHQISCIGNGWAWSRLSRLVLVTVSLFCSWLTSVLWWRSHTWAGRLHALPVYRR